MRKSHGQFYSGSARGGFELFEKFQLMQRELSGECAQAMEVRKDQHDFEFLSAHFVDLGDQHVADLFGPEILPFDDDPVPGRTDQVTKQKFNFAHDGFAVSRFDFRVGSAHVDPMAEFGVFQLETLRFGKGNSRKLRPAVLDMAMDLGARGSGDLDGDIVVRAVVFGFARE